MDFEGKRIVVTGAASGIGAACVAMLKARGANIIGLDINEPSAGSVDEFIKFNQSDLASIDEATAKLPSDLDGLLNIAGIAPSPSFSPADVLKINFFGLRYFTEKLVGKLKDNAAIINMSSGTGSGWPTNIENIKTVLAMDEMSQIDDFVTEHNIVMDGLGNEAAYPFSKQLLSVWTMKASSKWLDRGIRVNAVAPAAVDTPIVDDFMTSFGDDAVKRMARFGAATPENVARATLFLLSEEAVWVNGAVLLVDGGAIAAGTMAKLGI